MLEYLDNFARDYLPVDHLNHKNILNHTRLHIITRDHSGKPLMLSTVEIANFNKLLTCNIIYCRGSKRKNIISLLLGLRYVQKEFGEDIIFENWAPNKEIESIMRKFGSKIVGYYDLYTQI